MFQKGPYKSKEIPGELYYIVEKFIKKLKACHWLRSKRKIGKWEENSLNLLRKSTEICRKLNDPRELRNEFIGQFARLDNLKIRRNL